MSGRKTRRATSEANVPRRRGEAEDGAAELPLNMPLLRASLRAETRSRLDGARRADSLRLIQQTHGNAYVQRLMQPAAAAIQRQTGAAASRTVPGLPGDVVDKIQARLADSRQSALDALTAALAGRGSIDLSFLAGGTLTVVDDASQMAPGHLGHTTLTEGTDRPRPSKVVIGPDAFHSVGDLYATVVHEWKHVLQFRKPELIGDAMAEFEAFLWEVENLDQTGLWRDADYMQRIGNLLRGYWSNLTDVEKAAMRLSYESAQDTIIKKRAQALQEYRERVKAGAKK